MHEGEPLHPQSFGNQHESILDASVIVVGVIGYCST